MPDPRVYEPVRPTGEDVHYGDVAGVPADALSEQVAALGRAIVDLETAIRAPRRNMSKRGTAQDDTDSSGNLTFAVVQAGAGMTLYLSRLVLECATFDAVNPRTPASPWATSSAWIGVFDSTDPRNVAQGQLLDFLPTVAGGQVLPAVAQYTPTSDDTAALMIPSMHYLVCKVVAGPASQRVSAHYQGFERAE